MTTTPSPQYLLGSSPEELDRLERQSERLAAPTRLLLQRAGLQPGMRVLDLGTGLGDVALLAAELVGPTGSVVGVDRAPDALAVAEQRRLRRGLTTVRFVEGDVHAYLDPRPFDAVVGRLLLLHLPEPLAVVRHHAAALVPGGRWIALDYDCTGLRAEPATPLVDRACEWVRRGFVVGKADPGIGARLRTLLATAGLGAVQALGVQDYLAPDDPYGPASLAVVLKAMLPALIGAGLATAEEVGLATLADRLGAELKAAGAVLVPPTLAGAWGLKA